MKLEEYLRSVPKVELHVHLEGAIGPVTLLELARRNRVSLPADDVEGLRRWFAFRDFDHFIEAYITVTRCLRTREDYELVVYEFGREMARQNIRYAEVTFSPSTHHWLGVSEAVYLQGITKGREQAEKDFGVQIQWIFDIVRNSGTPEDSSDYTTRIAIEGKEIGVVALGLGGKEAGHPPEFFERWFNRARSAGLRSVPHAGELAGPESVWGALRALGAERIGHGVRSIEDPALVEYLTGKKIPLEICPTSNIRLGVYPNLESHSILRLHDAGVVVTINCDDPALFNATMNDELLSVASTLNPPNAFFKNILLNGIRGSFLPPRRKQKLEMEMEDFSLGVPKGSG